MTSRTGGGTRGWVLDVLLGGVPGGVLGAIVAVNIVIFSGIDRGYEASIPEVFRENVVVGTVVVLVLLAGPVLGVWAVRRLRLAMARR